MSFRSLALFLLLVLTLALGGWILSIPTKDGVTENIALRQSAKLGQMTNPKPAAFSQVILDKLAYLSNLFRSDHELLLYGSIAVFGILIMIMAIAGAKSAPKETAASMVEVLKQEKEKAEHVAKLKAEFLNQVSHELRTPLAVIIGYIECITDGLYGEIESKHHEILQIVAKQSSHLKNMIDQILIFSRLEANKQPLRIEEFPVSKLFNDLRDTFDFLCRQKGLELRWDLARDIDTLKTDPERFKEIISNLLQNAVKYTDRGVILVRFIQFTTETVAIEVSDTGIGIAHNHLSNIFDPFMQAHKTSSENSRGGIGLGLSIVKKHVEQMKGTITVDSQLGKGTTFKMILPRVYQDQKLRRHRLRQLINLPITRIKTNINTASRASSDRRDEETEINQAV